jgi:hypothetical protein
LHGEIDCQGRCGSRGILLRRLKTEHQDRVFAGSGGQAADFKPSRIVGDCRNFVGAAFSRDGGAGNGLPTGAHDAGLHIGSGNCGENQESDARGSQHRKISLHLEHTISI